MENRTTERSNTANADRMMIDVSEYAEIKEKNETLKATVITMQREIVNLRRGLSDAKETVEADKAFIEKLSEQHEAELEAARAACFGLSDWDIRRLIKLDERVDAVGRMYEYGSSDIGCVLSVLGIKARKEVMKSDHTKG